MGEEEDQEQVEVSMSNTSISKKGKKKVRRVHHCKRVMIAANDQSQRSYLSQSRIATTGYKRKIRDLLMNNRSLAKALAQSESMVSKLEKEIAQLQWQINIRSVVNMKLNQASGKLSSMATLLKETASIVMEAINCSHAAPIDESLTIQSLLFNSNLQNMKTPEASSLPQDKNEEATINIPFLGNIFAPQNQVKTNDMSTIEEVPGATEELALPCPENDDPKGVDCCGSEVDIAPMSRSRSSLKRKSSLRLHTPPRKSTPPGLCETPKTPPFHLASLKFKSNIPKPKTKEIKKPGESVVNASEIRTISSPVQLFNSPVQQCSKNSANTRFAPQLLNKKKIISSQDKAAKNSNDSKKSPSRKNEHLVTKPYSGGSASSSGVNTNAGIKEKVIKNVAKTSSKINCNDEKLKLTSSNEEKVKLFSEEEQKNSSLNLRRHTFVIKKGTELSANADEKMTSAVVVTDKSIRNRKSSLRAKQLDFKNMNKENDNKLEIVNANLKPNTAPKNTVPEIVGTNTAPKNTVPEIVGTHTAPKNTVPEIVGTNIALQHNSRKTESDSKLPSAEASAPISKVCMTPNSPVAALGENFVNSTNMSTDIDNRSGVTADVFVSKSAESQEHPNVTICVVEDMSLTEVLPPDFVTQIAPTRQNVISNENAIPKDDGCLGIEVEDNASQKDNTYTASEVISNNDKQGSAASEYVPDEASKKDIPCSSHLEKKSTRKRKTNYVEFLSSFDSNDSDPDFNLESFQVKSTRRSSTRLKKTGKADSASLNDKKQKIHSKKKEKFVSPNASLKKEETTVANCEKQQQPELKIFDFFTDASDEPVNSHARSKSKHGKNVKSKHKHCSTSSRKINNLNDDIITNMIEQSQKKKKASAEKQKKNNNVLESDNNVGKLHTEETIQGSSTQSNIAIEKDVVDSQEQRTFLKHKNVCFDDAVAQTVEQEHVHGLPKRKDKSTKHKEKKAIHDDSDVDLPVDIELDHIDSCQINNITRKRSKYSKDDVCNISADDNDENLLPKTKLVQRELSPAIKKPSKFPLSQNNENDIGDFMICGAKTPEKTSEKKADSHKKHDPVKTLKKDHKLLDQPHVEMEQLSPSLKKKILNSGTVSCSIVSDKNKNILKPRNSPSSKHKADVQFPSPEINKNLSMSNERNDFPSSKNSISDAIEVCTDKTAFRGRATSTCSTESDYQERGVRESRRKQRVSYKEISLNKKMRRP